MGYSRAGFDEIVGVDIAPGSRSNSSNEGPSLLRPLIGGLGLADV